MILYQNHLIVLNYDPSKDILYMDWPSVHPYNIGEVETALNVLLENIRNYDVKRLLIDASNTTIEPQLLENERYKAVLLEFSLGLAKTRLVKSARVLTTDKARETKAKQLSEEVVKKTNLSIYSMQFATKPEAEAWLLA